MTLIDKFIIKILNLKLVILLEYQNIKIFLKKVILQIGLKTFFWLKKLKILALVELDLSNYPTKTDLKTAAGVDTSKFAKKVDLVNLKSNVDKLDTDKLKHVPTNLSDLKSKVDKLDVDKLASVPVDLSKLLFFYISNLVVKTTGLNLGKKLSNLLSDCEALN